MGDNRRKNRYQRPNPNPHHVHFQQQKTEESEQQTEGVWRPMISSDEKGRQRGSGHLFNEDKQIKIEDIFVGLKTLIRSKPDLMDCLEKFDFKIAYFSSKNKSDDKQKNKRKWVYDKFLNIKTTHHNEQTIIFLVDFLNIIEDGESMYFINQIKQNFNKILRHQRGDDKDKENKCSKEIDLYIGDLIKQIENMKKDYPKIEKINDYKYIPSKDLASYYSSNNKHDNSDNNKKNKTAIEIHRIIEILALETFIISPTKMDGNFFSIINEVKKGILHLAKNAKDIHTDANYANIKVILCLIKKLQTKYPIYVDVVDFTTSGMVQLETADKDKPHSKDPRDINNNFKLDTIPIKEFSALDTPECKEFRKKLESLNNKLTEINRSKIIDSAGKYHTIKDPLIAILNILQLGQRQYILTSSIATAITTFPGIDPNIELIDNFFTEFGVAPINELLQKPNSNSYLNPNDHNTIKTLISGMKNKAKRPNNATEIFDLGNSILSSKNTPEGTQTKLKLLRAMIENENLKKPDGNDTLAAHPDRIDLKKQIPGSRADALRILNAGFEHDKHLLYIKRMVAKSVTEKKINSIFFQENENELIIWINPNCVIDEEKIEHTVLLPRRIYLWILSIVNENTKILYHSVTINKGKEVPNYVNIDYMETLCKMHNLPFYFIEKYEKFKIMDIVNCNKQITIQDLGNTIDEYLSVPLTFKTCCTKTIDISDNDNQFSLVFNKSQYSVIVKYNENLFSTYKDFSITAFHIVMNKVNNKSWIKIKYNSNLASIRQIYDIYRSVFYNKYFNF